MKKMMMNLKVKWAVIVLSILSLVLWDIPILQAVSDEEKVTGQIPLSEGVEEPKLPEYAPGEVLVKFKEGVEPEEALKEISIKGIERVHPITEVVAGFKKDYKLEKDSDGWYWFLGKKYKEIVEISDEVAFKEAYKQMAPEEKSLYRTHKVYLAEGMSVEEAVAALKKNPDVEYAQPNYIMQLNTLPNDPYYRSSRTWGQAYDDLWGLKRINSQAARDTTEGQGVVVAVIDSGVDYNHPDLRDNIYRNPDGSVKGYDFSDNDTDPMDALGHGTHVAGTIAAQGNNNIGVIGVAPKAKIMPVKIFPNAYSDVSARGIRYAADNGAKILSNSWGPMFRNPSDPTIEGAIDYAYAKNKVVVFAAGNNNDDVAYYSPNNYSKVIKVSAYTQNDEKCSFSNYGVAIDVAAPGGGYINELGRGDSDKYNILSTMPDNSDFARQLPMLKISDGYWRLGGTSMACPHVSGLAALLLSKTPTLTNEEVRQIIRVSAYDVGTLGWDLFSGFGRINIFEALKKDSVCSAKITSPLSYPDLTGVISIYGRAAGAKFSNYKLECGLGTSPQSWRLISAGSSPVQNNILASNWNTVLLSDGQWTLRLTVTDSSGSIYEDRVLVNIRNTFISSPQERDFISAQGNIVEIRGTTTQAADFLNYKIEYIPTDDYGVYTGPANTTGITLTNGGNSPVVNGLLGEFDTNVITKAGIYTLRLTTSTSTVTNSHEIAIYLDPLLKKGWPQQIPYSPGVSTYMFSTHTIADVNADGTSEIIIGYENNIYIFQSDGKFLPGWPQRIGYKIQKSPVVGDLDGDGYMEIVSGLGQYVWNHDGTLVENWPNLSSSGGEPIIDDINGDGELEIVLVTYGKVDVVDIRGNHLPGWPSDIGVVWWGWGYSNPAVGDIDKDGKKEIAVVTFNPSNSSQLYICNFNGTCRAVGPELQSIGLSLALGDLDSDSDLEIIISSNDKKIYSLHHDGTNVSGWPVILTHPLGYSLRELNSPTLGDIDSDGRPEIIVGAEDERKNSLLYAFRSDGSLVNNGWPIIIDRRQTWIKRLHSFFGCSPAAIGDIDLDGNKEIIFSDNSPYLNIRRANVSDVSGIVLRASDLGAQRANMPALADIDGDGKTEVVWVDCNFKVFVWDLPGYYDSTKIEWGQYRHDSRHTSYYIPPDPTPPATPVVTDEGVSTHSLTTLSASWSSQNSSSTIAEYLYRITEDTTQGTLIRDWTFVGTATSVIATGLNLNIGKTYYFSVKARDGAGLLSEIGYSDGITVTNQPPVLTPIGNKSVDVGTLLSFTISATDAAGDTLTYLVTGLPEGASFNPLDYTFSWTPSYTQAGSYPLTLSVSDGNGGTASETITITVNNVNRQPVITPIEDQTVHSGERLAFRVEANDPDGDSLSFSAVNLPPGATLNPDTGEFSWLPGTQHIGRRYTITFTASDGTLSASTTTVVTVRNPNRPPRFWPIGDKTVREGALLMFAVIAIDPEGQRLTYEVSGLPQGASFDPARKLFMWTPDFTQARTYTVTFTASDGELSDTKTVTITVQNFNRRPLLSAISNQNIPVGERLSFTLQANDPDGDRLTYSYSAIGNLPAGAVLNVETGVFTWTPTVAQAGTYYLRFEVTDGEMNSYRTIIIRVQRILSLAGTILSRPTTSSRERRPVAGMRVELQVITNAPLPPPSNVTTDAQGRFRFAGLAPGLYRVKPLLQGRGLSIMPPHWLVLLSNSERTGADFLITERR